jgi:hypothetical protein
MGILFTLIFGMFMFSFVAVLIAGVGVAAFRKAKGLGPVDQPSLKEYRQLKELFEKDELPKFKIKRFKKLSKKYEIKGW